MIKTVILAAGMARRLQPLTNKTPKCLLKTGNRTLLDRILDSVRKAGLRDIVIVTGFESQQIKQHIAAFHPELSIEFIHNERFDETNNIYSLWLTRQSLEGQQLLLLDSDILFHHQILKKLLDGEQRSCLALRESDKLGDEEIKITVDESGFVKSISKEVPTHLAIGESLGIEFFSTADTLTLFESVHRFVAEKGRVNDFYEVAFEEVISRGMKIRPVPVGDLPCMEIDTAADLEAALPLAEKLDKESNSYI